jgi:hypothetical protein
MAQGILEAKDFNTYHDISERLMRSNTIAADDAFAAAMRRAIKRGREKATPGTFVDTTPAIGARRIRGDVVMSACGSPAAMCADFTSPGGGALTLK